MNNLKVISCIGLLLLSMSENYGQESHKFDLSESVDYALKNSYLIQEVGLKNSATDNTIELSKSEFLPQVSAYLNYFQFLTKPTYIFPEAEGNVLSGGNAGGPYPVELGQDFNLYTGVGMSQVVFDGRWLNKKDIIKHSNELKELSFKDTEEKIIYSVTSAYYNIISLQNQLSLLDNNLQTIKKLLKVMEVQQQNGLIRLSQVQGLQVKINNLEANRNKTEAEYEQMLIRLKFLIGMPFEDNLEIESFISHEVETLRNITQSDGTHTQLLMQKKEMEISHQKNIRATYLPSIKAYASFQFQAQRSELNFFSNEEWFSTHLFGIGVNIPILKGLSKKSEIQKSNVNISLIELNLKRLENQTSFEYLSAKSQLEHAKVQIDGQKQNSSLADKVYKEALVSYEQGIMSLSELMESESALREAESLYQSAIYDYKIAELNLYKASGNLKSLLN